MLTKNKKLNLVLLLTYMGYFGLIGVMSFNCIVHDDHSWKLWIFQTIPLLLVLPGIIKQHFRAYSWLCFIILAYFIAYVVEVGSPIGDLSDWIGLTLSVIIFVGAMMSSRLLQRL
jgi:uncharacterized membrane protein